VIVSVSLIFTTLRLAYLKKPLQPPDLEETLADEEYQLEDAPPLDARVCALSRIPVGPLADDDITLLVLDLGSEF
jgi:hypothetical protein